MTPPPTSPPRRAGPGGGPVGVHRLLFGVLAVLLLALQSTVWDEPAAVTYADQTFKRALVAFGVARGINAAISVLQESEVRFGVGVGASVKPGQALDPVNDLVERFSWVMLVTSITAFAIKLLSQLMLGAEAVALLASVTGLSLLLMLSRAGWAVQTGALLFRAGSVVAIVFLAVTLVPLASNGFHGIERVAQSYETSRDALTTATREVEDLTAAPTVAVPPPVPETATPDPVPATGDEATLWEDTKRFFGERLPRYIEDRRLDVEEAAGRYLSRLDVGERLEQARHMATDLPEQVVVQIAVFTLEVFVVPLLVLWAGYRLAAVQWRRGAPLGA